MTNRPPAPRQVKYARLAAERHTRAEQTYRHPLAVRSIAHIGTPDYDRALRLAWAPGHKDASRYVPARTLAKADQDAGLMFLRRGNSVTRAAELARADMAKFYEGGGGGGRRSPCPRSPRPDLVYRTKKTAARRPTQPSRRQSPHHHGQPRSLPPTQTRRNPMQKLLDPGSNDTASRL